MTISRTDAQAYLSSLTGAGREAPSHIELKTESGSFKVKIGESGNDGSLIRADKKLKAANIVRTIFLVGAIIGCFVCIGSAAAHAHNAHLGIKHLTGAKGVGAGIGCLIFAVGMGIGIGAAKEQREAIEKELKKYRIQEGFF